MYRYEGLGALRLVAADSKSVGDSHSWASDRVRIFRITGLRCTFTVIASRIAVCRRRRKQSASPAAASSLGNVGRSVTVQLWMRRQGELDGRAVR
jgi:hypothetical protein